MNILDRIHDRRSAIRRARAIQRALRAATTPAAQAEIQAIVNRYR